MLLPLVYNELRHLADHYLRHERTADRLQAPALVHGYDARTAEPREKNPATVYGRKRALDLYEKWPQPDRAAGYRAIR